MGLENKTSDIGSTLNPQVRFFVFDAEPNMERLVPPLPGNAAAGAAGAAHDERRGHRSGVLAAARAGPVSRRSGSIAEAALTDPPRPIARRPTGLADLLWAVTMKPEFQLIY